MAKINIDSFRKLLNEHTDWKEQGLLSADQICELYLSSDTEEHNEMYDESLANKTLTYEGRNVTVVLDFDKNGYLNNIELV